ncbi:HD domain-containing protein [Thermotoga neapolitana]|uniref:HD domain-containing protein n=1 Tax=Thermotoga neapolitana TaxID=2337 RepID=UPI00059C215D|nr:HD domain-containing protein [Thermotoga neapolitana]HBF11373.1 HD domain-containing protein [Thermotoga neapolitana]
MFKKVSRDPVHSEIYLYPLEILVADTKVVQRLRFLSQLAGATMVYPGATHTRFAHSLGTMHIAGIYARNLFDDHSRIRLIRLAALLHDVGHGPFSHQFDDVVFKKYGYEDGHDEFRDRLILEKLPEEMKRVYNTYNSRLKRAVEEDVTKTVGDLPIEEAFQEIAKRVVEIFRGEETGSVDFNVIQGPLGADRLDFLLRDSYHSGVGHFAPMNVDRVLRNSLVRVKDGKEILCYHVKVVDNIYSILFSRFMMYKNVYFHKTSRAADLMIQEMLSYACEILNLEERLKDLDEFLELTDYSILKELEMKGDERVKKLINRFKNRDLWKMVVERPFSAEGFDPSELSLSAAQNLIDRIVENIRSVLESGDVEDEDKKILSDICERKDDYFRIDTPYKLTIFHPDEFLQNNVFLYDPGSDEVLTVDEYVKKYPAYRLMVSNMIQIVRIYVTEDVREILYRYRVVPEDGRRAVTRW